MGTSGLSRMGCIFIAPNRSSRPIAAFAISVVPNRVDCRSGHAAAAPLHRTFPIVAGGNQRLFLRALEEYTSMRLSCISNTDAFMDIEEQLRKAKLRHRPSKKAAANADFLAQAVESAAPPSCARFERPHGSNRSSAPWAGGFLEATIYEHRDRSR